MLSAPPGKRGGGTPGAHGDILLPTTSQTFREKRRPVGRQLVHLAVEEDMVNVWIRSLLRQTSSAPYQGGGGHGDDNDDVPRGYEIVGFFRRVGQFANALGVVFRAIECFSVISFLACCS
jgi:hypothetical protein